MSKKKNMDFEILTTCFTHRELARMYLSRLEDSERLREELKRCRKSVSSEKADAIKEFADRLKGRFNICKSAMYSQTSVHDVIDRVKKEMTVDATNICACDLMCEMFGVFANLVAQGNRKQTEGEWEDEQQPYTTSLGARGTSHYRRCSACKWEYPVVTVSQHFKKYKYCPNCGAKMKGGAE